MGRPSEYDAPTHIAAVLSHECISRGATWTAIAEACEKSPATVKTWADKHPEFLAAVKGAKNAVDDAVEQAFHLNAVGGAVKSRKRDSYGREITEYFSPDTTAGIFWLCNRRPDRWRHVQRVEHTGADGGPITTKDVSDEQSRAYAEAALRTVEAAEAITAGAIGD